MLESFWTFIHQIITEPPQILVAIVVALLVAHAIKIISDAVSKHSGYSLIAVLELLLVFVLVIITLKAYFYDSISPDGDSISRIMATVPYLILLLVFGVLSMYLYKQWDKK